MKKLVVLLAVSAVALGVYSAMTKTRAVSERAPVVVARPKAGGVQAIVSATPFTVAHAWTHTWRSEKPSYDAGWLVVLDVDTKYVKPTQMEEPVLFAGAETVERVNHGYESGRVVAIVPSRRTAGGQLELDLSVTPLWFGTPGLPDQTDAVRVQSELSKARAIGVMPLSVPVLGELMELDSRDDLDALCGELVLEHSPEEQDLGLGLLVPRVK